MIFEGLIIETGEVVSIDDVPSGLKCNCICPNCHVRLIAKKGKKNVHHFAHVNGAECSLSKKNPLSISSSREKLLEQPEERISTYNCRKKEIIIQEIRQRTKKFTLFELWDKHKKPFTAHCDRFEVDVKECYNNNNHPIIMGIIRWPNDEPWYKRQKEQILTANKPIWRDNFSK